ncbi:MAG: hypothetical protein AAGG68_24135 [Bacteroidota bacterium]
MGRATVLGVSPSTVALPRKISARRKARQMVKIEIEHYLDYSVLCPFHQYFNR